MRYLLIISILFLFGCTETERTSHYNNGQIEYFSNINEDGELQGEALHYYKNGQLKFKQNYNNGILEGKSVFYYENGQLKIKKNYNNGMLEGEWNSYYENGQLAGLGSFDNAPDNAFRDGEHADSEDSVPIKNRIGKWIFYHKGGGIKSEIIYKDGKIEGRRLEYHTNGQISSEENYKDGKIEGELVSYHQNGQLKGKSNHKDGKQIGKSVYYYANGNISYELDRNSEGTKKVEYNEDGSFYRWVTRDKYGVLIDYYPK